MPAGSASRLRSSHTPYIESRGDAVMPSRRWVGLWDLLDVHVLPALFTACKHEPTTGCAFVKLGLVAIGAIGLYLTRSLYGEEGVTVVQFQRL